MRFVGAGAVIVLAGLVALAPATSAPAHFSNIEAQAPPIAVCSVEEGSGRATTLSALSRANGPVHLTLFAGGASVGEAELGTGASGSVTLPIGGVAAIGITGGLVELPVTDSAAGVVLSGEESLAAESCPSVPGREVMLAGGSTTEGAAMEVHILNPYSSEAVTQLRVVSEAGVETNDDFESVVVPARSTVILDLGEILPGRDVIWVTVETMRGSVLAVGRQTRSGDVAIWGAVEPAQDWFVPVGTQDVGKRILITSPLGTDIEYRVEVLSTEAMIEGEIAGVLPAHGHVWVDVGEFSTGGAAFRVSSTEGVVATLWVDAPGAVGASPGAPVGANTWFLPGAGEPEGGLAAMTILNTGLETATITLRPLGTDDRPNQFTIEPNAVVEVRLRAADGYLVEATDPVVAMWTATRKDAGTVAIGVPLQDG